MTEPGNTAKSASEWQVERWVADVRFAVDVMGVAHALLVLDYVRSAWGSFAHGLVMGRLDSAERDRLLVADVERVMDQQRVAEDAGDEPGWMAGTAVANDARFMLRAADDNGAHVRFDVLAATGGQHLGVCGSLTMQRTEFEVFRDLLKPVLTDRTDVPGPDEPTGEQAAQERTQAGAGGPDSRERAAAEGRPWVEFDDPLTPGAEGSKGA